MLDFANFVKSGWSDLNFYARKTVHKQDFGAKFNLSYHDGAPVADILSI